MTAVSSTSSAKADAYYYLQKAPRIFVNFAAESAVSLAFLSVVSAMLSRRFGNSWASTKVLYENLGPNSSYFELFDITTKALIKYPQAVGWTAIANGILGKNTANAMGDLFEKAVVGRIEPSLATQNIITGVACCLIFAFSMKEAISKAASEKRNYKIVNSSFVANLSQRVSTAVAEILSLFRRTIAAATDLAANIFCNRSLTQAKLH